MFLPPLFVQKFYPPKFPAFFETDVWQETWPIPLTCFTKKCMTLNKSDHTNLDVFYPQGVRGTTTQECTTSRGSSWWPFFHSLNRNCLRAGGKFPQTLTKADQLNCRIERLNANTFSGWLTVSTLPLSHLAVMLCSEIGINNPNFYRSPDFLYTWCILLWILSGKIFAWSPFPGTWTLRGESGSGDFLRTWTYLQSILFSNMS